MNFLRSLLRDSSQGIVIDQNDQSNTAIVVHLFTVRNTKFQRRQDVRKREEVEFLYNKISAYEYYSSFKQFGAIKYFDFFVKYHLFYTSFCAYVEYYDSQSVEAVSLNHRIKIGDNYVAVKKSGRKFRKENKKIKIDKILLQAPDESSSKNILNILNDDCLREIFKKLTFGDQCSGLGVCVRFNRIFRECLAKNQKFSVFDTRASVETFLSTPLQQTNNYLRNLGSSLYKMKIDTFYFLENQQSERILLGMIRKHCKNIRKLDINFRHRPFFHLHRFTDLIPLFERLEHLHLRSSRMYLDSLLPVCSQLKVLNLEDFNGEYDTKYLLPPIKLPQLVAFRWKFYCKSEQYISSLKIFLSLNTQLGYLSFMGCKWMSNDFDSENHLMIGQLKRLKFLEITKYHDYRQPTFMVVHLIRNLLLNNVPIEHLKLEYYIQIDEETIEYISQMKTIQKLEFTDVVEFHERYLFRLASNLPNLEAILWRQHDQLDFILDNISIHRILRELKEKYPSATILIRELVNTNTFTNHYEHVNAEVATIPLADINGHRYWLSIFSFVFYYHKFEKFRTIFQFY